MKQNCHNPENKHTWRCHLSSKFQESSKFSVLGFYNFKNKSHKIKIYSASVGMNKKKKKIKNTSWNIYILNDVRVSVILGVPSMSRWAVVSQNIYQDQTDLFCSHSAVSNYKYTSECFSADCLSAVICIDRKHCCLTHTVFFNENNMYFKHEVSGNHRKLS